MRLFLSMCSADWRAFCLLRVFASILYEVSVNVCLLAHERVCVVYVCRVSTIVYACVTYAECSCFLYVSCQPAYFLCAACVCEFLV